MQNDQSPLQVQWVQDLWGDWGDWGITITIGITIAITIGI
jgi:hypothetical protein